MNLLVLISYLKCLLLLTAAVSADLQAEKGEVHRTKTTYFQDLEGMLRSSQDIPIDLAQMIIKSLGPAVLNTPLYGSRPILHHLINLFVTSRDPDTRKGLIRLAKTAVTQDADVNAVFGKDPTILMKTLVLREMELAQSIVSFGGSRFTLDADTISLLYSLPCDSVPLSKLLLHTDTLVRRDENSSTPSGETEKDRSRSSTNHNKNQTHAIRARKLLLSASLDPGAKPSVKAAELFSISKSFGSFLHEFGTDRLREGLQLTRVLDFLGDVAASIQDLWLQKSVRRNTRTLFKRLAERDVLGRNPLHRLALSGSNSFLLSIIRAFEQSNTGKDIEQNDDATAKREQELSKVAEQLRGALESRDIRGLSPIDYARIRWEGSEFFRSMSSLALSSGVTDISASDIQSDSSSDSRPVPVPELVLEESPGNSGGWSVEGLTEEPFAPKDASRCDIEVVDGPPLPEHFFQRYVSRSRPVIFRGATEGPLLKAFQRDAFLGVFGNYSIGVSSIPYAGSFGVKTKFIPVSEAAEGDSSVLRLFAELSVTSTESCASDASSDGDMNLKTADEGHVSADVPVYAFTTAPKEWRQELEERAPPPAFLVEALNYSHTVIQNSFISKGLQVQAAPFKITANELETQFYLGPPGSGAPAHYHGHAVNSLAYGQKRWFIYRPSDAFYSTRPAYEFVRDGSAESSGALQCTQFAGDVIYIPSLYGHATLNIQQSIGVAHEFSVERLCME